MSGDVTLGMGSRPSLSLAAMMGPEAVCSRVTGRSCSDTPLKRKDFDCAMYQYSGMNSERNCWLLNRVMKYRI